jgi:PAS domain S-box-containing protein
MTNNFYSLPANADLLYISIFEATPGNSILLDTNAPTFTILAATHQYLRQGTYLRSDLIGKGFFEAFPVEAVNQEHTGEQNIKASLQHVLEFKQPHHLPVQRYDIKNADTSVTEKYSKASNTPVLTPDGEVVFIIHSIEDITHEIKAREQEERILRMEHSHDLFRQAQQGEEAKSERQKRLYETITNNTPDLIYVFELNYQFKYANKALLEMWGKTWEQSVGKGLRENGYEEWHALMHEREIDQVAATKQSVRGEVSFPHATLGKRIYDYILVPVLNENGEVEAVAGTTRDITELKVSEHAIAESNERFSKLADDSPLFIFIIDADPLAPVSYWNKPWLDYTGQTYEEAIGRAWDGIIHPDDVSIVMDHYSRAFENRQPYLIPSVRVKRYDGEFRWHAFKANPRYSAGGVFNGYVGVGFDVHEQELAEQALKQSEARVRAAIDIARLGTFEIDVENQTIIHSPRTAEILGLDPAKQWPYHAILDTVHPDDVHIRLKALEEAKQTGMLFYEARIVHPDESIRWVRLNGRYLRQDNRPKIIGTLMDVTEEKKAAEVLEQKVEERTKELEHVVQALKESNQELARSNTNLEEFAYAASHDLKEPIRKVITFLDRVKRSLGDLTTSQEHLFDRVEIATQRMGLLVDDLLTFSHVSERPLEKEAVDLNVKMERVLNDLELLIEEKKATIQVGKLPVVSGYRRQLQQLFQNLIGNSLKYSQPERPPVVMVSAQTVFGKDVADKVLPEYAERRFHLVQVTDNGIGFEQGYAERIFKMFQRLHGKAEIPGSGVGLSIARKVVDNHGGYIWAESQPDKGATFSVLLPAD